MSTKMQKVFRMKEGTDETSYAKTSYIQVVFLKNFPFTFDSILTWNQWLDVLVVFFIKSYKSKV